MESTLERTLRLKTGGEIASPNLYSHAIVEVDHAGQQVGSERIPWPHTLFFFSSELTISDLTHYEISNGLGRPHPKEFAETRVIQAILQPTVALRSRPWTGHPTYRMFGTDRRIENFTLDIAPSDNFDEQECSAWGCPSYIVEMDFTQELVDDAVHFYWTVPRATYDRYLWTFANGLADQVRFSARGVSGFYSDWSPSIDADEIKVLTTQNQPIFGEAEGSMPRLGPIGRGELALISTRSVTLAQDTEA